VVSHHEVVRETAESGVARMITAMALLMPAAGLMQTLANLADYRQPAVAVAVWAALFPAAAWLLPRARPDGLTAPAAALAVLIAAAAVTAIGWEHRPDRGSGSVDLAILGTAGRALQLYATGMPLKSVARKMAISDETVKQYLQRLRLKYANAGRAAPTKLELYHRAVEDGHIPRGLLSSRSRRDCYHRAVEDGRIPTSS
jgi:DNA-binding CsgD family transcriptional regulator